MKRFICMILTLLILFTSGLTCHAEDSSMSFLFELTTDGKSEKQVETGDIITITFKLKRSDSDTDYTMYAMQNEILYDKEFFELVDDGVIASNGIETKDLQLRDGGKAFYMNYASMTGGEEWKADTTIGSFQLKVIGTKGSSTIANSANIVSTKDGADSYSVSGQDVTVIISKECTVKFETNGGSAVEDQIVEVGNKLQEPANPTKEGYSFDGWYKDIDLTQKWDFRNDTVEGNMTLYAKWVKGSSVPVTGDRQTILLLVVIAVIALLVAVLLGRRKKVCFNTQGGNSIPPCRVKKGTVIKAPKAPTKDGGVFKGWFKDPECNEDWDFENDKVDSHITLYAKWEE